MALTTKEEMALEVLRGNDTAAKALAQMLLDDEATALYTLPPVHKITSDVSKIRVVVYFPVMIGGEPVEIDTTSIEEHVQAWITAPPEDQGLLVLQGAERIELYELP